MLKVIGGAQEGEFKAVASGTLPNGKPVVVNSDGTVSVVGVSDVTQASGTPVLFEDAVTANTSSVYVSSAKKVVIAYRDSGNSGHGTAIVGTVSGTSISFGTAVVFEAASTQSVSAVYDVDSDKLVISYRDDGNSSYGTSIVGTVSGTSITFGSPVVFRTSSTSDITSTYDTEAQKVVIAYNSLGGKAIVGTVSGTSISFGSATSYNGSSSYWQSIAYDSTAQKVVISYADNSFGYDRGTAIVGTVSGTSISFGSSVVFDSDTVSHTSAVYDGVSGKVVISYRDQGNSGYGTAIVGTVSGTSISFGSAVVFESAGTSNISSVYDSNAQKVVVSYSDEGNGPLYNTAAVGTVSGTSISFAAPVVLASVFSRDISSVYDAGSRRVVVAYSDDNNSDKGKAVVFRNAGSETNLTSENYIGMSSGGAVVDTAAAKIDIIGAVNKSQSGLTSGQKYYVQTDGTIGLTAADPSVLAGTAISATSLVVKT